MMFTETGRPTLKYLTICIVFGLIMTYAFTPRKDCTEKLMESQQELGELRQTVASHSDITKALFKAAARRDQFRSSMTPREFALWAALVEEAKLDDGFEMKEKWFNAVDSGRPIYVQFEDPHDKMMYTFVVGLRITGQNRQPGENVEPCFTFYTGSQNGAANRFSEGFHPSKMEVLVNGDWQSEESGSMLAHYNTSTTEIVERHLGLLW